MRKRAGSSISATSKRSNSKPKVESKAKTAGITTKNPKPAPVWRIEEFTRLSVEARASALPFCMAENITLKQFHAKIKHMEKAGKSESTGGYFRWEFKDGKAWIYELPHAAHERTAGRLIAEISHGLTPHNRAVIFSPSPRCDDNTAHLSMEPDGSVKVRGNRPGAGHPDAADAAGNRWGNVIVEVAFRESEIHVRGKALAWLDACNNPNFGVQQVIVVKIGPTVRVDGHRTMKAWRYARGAANNPVQSIEFGNHGPNHGATVANLPGMQLQIPVASIFYPAAAPAGLGANIDIDLFHVRQDIEDAFG